MAVGGAGREGARQEAGYLGKDRYGDMGGRKDERRKKSEDRDREMSQS
jgi:hypothetical protein